MRTSSLWLLFPALFFAGGARAETWTISVKAVNGRMSYAHEQAGPLEKQAAYAGKAQTRGGGPARAMSFNSLLHAPENGYFKLDYQAEVAGQPEGQPPFHVSGKALLRPGKPLVAAAAGGWKLILELNGEGGGKASGMRAGTLEAGLKCRGLSYAASFVYLPEERYSAALREDSGGEGRYFWVELLPGPYAAYDVFKLEYKVLLKDDGLTLCQGSGELVLTPGGGKLSAAAGKGCTFSAKALH
ncbi:MAG TPA: hypothetical protein PKI19_08025 [Elusimicrobiales bacterium]|nr:hypothetical protein [Elusimicrobiales bacterium]